MLARRSSRVPTMWPPALDAQNVPRAGVLPVARWSSYASIREIE
jgi:hypothetical protein